MPVYDVELDDGRKLEVTADTEPTQEEVLQALGETFVEDTGQSPLATFGSGVARGIGQTFTAIPGGLGAVQNLFQDDRSSLSQFADYAQGKVEETFPVNPANPVAAGIGSAVGQAAGMLATIPVGGAAGLGARGMTAAGLSMAGAAGAQQGEQAAIEAGITDPLARAGMVGGYGLAEAGVEALGGFGTSKYTKSLLKDLPEILKTGAPTSAIKQGIKTAVGEAAEEPLTGELQDLTTAALEQEDPNNPGFTKTGKKLTDPFSVDALKNRAAEFGYGLAGGAVFGGVHALRGNHDAAEVLDFRAAVAEKRKNGTVLPEEEEMADIKDRNAAELLRSLGMSTEEQTKWINTKLKIEDPVAKAVDQALEATAVNGAPETHDALFDLEAAAADKVDAENELAATEKAAETLPPVEEKPAPAPVEAPATEPASISPDSVEVPAVIERADTPSAIIPVRADSPAPPRPARNGRDTSERDAWDEQYGVMRKGGRTHNDDSSVYQPTLHDETAAAVLRDLAGSSLDEQVTAIGSGTNAELGTTVRQLLNDGWHWDSQQKKMVNPANPGETPLQGLLRIRGQTQSTAPAVEAPPAPVAKVEAPAKPGRRIPIGGGQWIDASDLVSPPAAVEPPPVIAEEAPVATSRLQELQARDFSELSTAERAELAALETGTVPPTVEPVVESTPAVEPSPVAEATPVTEAPAPEPAYEPEPVTGKLSYHKPSGEVTKIEYPKVEENGIKRAYFTNDVKKTYAQIAAGQEIRVPAEAAVRPEIQTETGADGIRRVTGVTVPINGSPMLVTDRKSAMEAYRLDNASAAKAEKAKVAAEVKESRAAQKTALVSELPESPNEKEFLVGAASTEKDSTMGMTRAGGLTQRVEAMLDKLPTPLDPVARDKALSQILDKQLMLKRIQHFIDTVHGGDKAAAAAAVDNETLRKRIESFDPSQVGNVNFSKPEIQQAIKDSAKAVATVEEEAAPVAVAAETEALPADEAARMNVIMEGMPANIRNAVDESPAWAQRFQDAHDQIAAKLGLTGETYALKDLVSRLKGKDSSGLNESTRKLVENIRKLELAAPLNGTPLAPGVEARAEEMRKLGLVEGDPSSIKGALQRINQDATGMHYHPSLRMVAGLFARMPGLSSIRGLTNDLDNPNLAGSFNPTTRAIRFNMGNDWGENYSVGQILVHEVGHALTFFKVNYPATAEDKALAAEIQALRAQIESYARNVRPDDFARYAYELGDTDEFITGVLSNPNFVDFLSTLPANLVAGEPATKKSNMFVRMLRKLWHAMLGKPVNAGTPLERSMNAIFNLVETPWTIPTEENVMQWWAEGETGSVAYHGTPHAVDRFSMDRVGTGEGVQAFGHGLYFAGNHEVAKSYQAQLGQGKGNLYTVDLLPEEDEYLIWDKPLNEQSDKVKASLRTLGIEEDIVDLLSASDEAGLSIPGGTDTYGAHIYMNVGDSENIQGERRWSPEAASKALLDAGIRGVKYLDAKSRGAGEGHYNYVIFDDADVKITHANGTPVTEAERDGVLSPKTKELGAPAFLKSFQSAGVKSRHAPTSLPLFATKDATGRKATGFLLGGGRKTAGQVEAQKKFEALQIKVQHELAIFNRDIRSAARKEYGSWDKAPMDLIRAAMGSNENRIDDALNTQLTQAKTAAKQTANGTRLAEFNRAKALEATDPAQAALIRQQAAAAHSVAVTAADAAFDAAMAQADAAWYAQKRAEQQDALNKLSPQTRQTVQDLRTALNIAQDALQSSGFISGKLIPIIDKSKGIWLHRSYQIWDDPKWSEYVLSDKPEAVAIRNKAATLAAAQIEARKAVALQRATPGMTKQQAIAQTKGTATQTEVGTWLEGWLKSATEDARGFLSGGAPGSKASSILKHRGDVHPTIQALWGVYKDPLINAGKSLASLQVHLGAQQMYADIMDEAQKNGFAFTDENAMPGARLVELKAKNDENVRKFPHLFQYKLDANGERVADKPFYGSPLFRDSFADMQPLAMNDTLWGKFISAYRTLTGYSMASKTLYSLQSTARDLLSNIVIMAVNGHVPSPGAIGKALSSGARDVGLDKLLEYMLSPVRGKNAPPLLDHKKMDAYLSKLLTLRVIGNTVNNNTVNELLKDVGARFRLRGDNINKVAKFLHDGVGMMHEKFGAYRALSDDIPKMIMFENELSRMQRWHPNMPLEEQEQRAAEKVRMTTPTYSETSDFVKFWRRQPFFSPFFTWPAEVVRITAGTYKLASQELRSTAAGEKVQGATRMLFLSGMLTALPYLLMAAARAARDEDDEDIATDKINESLARFVRPWQKDNDLLWLGRKGSKHSYLDISYLMPYATLSNPINEAFKQVAQTPENVTALDKLTGAAAGVLHELGKSFKEQILTGALLDIARNQRSAESGDPLYDPNLDAWTTKAAKSIEHLWFQALEPGIVRTGRNITNALEQKVDYSGRGYTLHNELAGIAGLKAMEQDIATGTLRLGNEYKRTLADAMAQASLPFSSSGTQDPGDLADAVTAMNDGRKKVLAEARKTWLAAQYLGMKREEATAQFKQSQLSDAEVGMILQNKYLRQGLGDQTLKKAAVNGKTLGQDRLAIYRSALESYPAEQPLAVE